MDDHKTEKKTESTGSRRWTPRRIAALIGILLLLAMYGSTMVFALMGSETAHTLLMASIYCTIAVPVLLYAMTLTAKNLRGRGTNPEIRDAYEKLQKERKQESADAPDDESGSGRADESDAEETDSPHGQ